MKRALFIGRFQPFHNAHLADVKKILKENDEVLIAIGSSQEKNTKDNPFSLNERKKMVTETLKKNKIKNFRMYHIPDAKTDAQWIKYIKKNLPKFDAVYSGNKRVLGIFKKYSRIKKIKLIKGISSTKIREMMAKNKNWQKLVPKKIIFYIKKLKGIERIKKLVKK
ncbi:MAG TPA: nicotinamide-nucleotide adenylyltransferase [Candidatus Nanoarchaeia archaeon]|nr:nicotinamide-nucleotide adenylyltransferase [Candidatus Nanoarchaeia archaeon]